MHLSAVLITGRGGRWYGNELYYPLTKLRCIVPNMQLRWYHRQEGGLVCGGGDKPQQVTCEKWDPSSGTWNQSHTLGDRRLAHVSWATASGVYLIGGWHTMGTSLKVKYDGSVEQGFLLKYPLRFIHMFTSN